MLAHSRKIAIAEVFSSCKGADRDRGINIYIYIYVYIKESLDFTKKSILERAYESGEARERKKESTDSGKGKLSLKKMKETTTEAGQAYSRRPWLASASPTWPSSPAQPMREWNERRKRKIERGSAK